MDDRAYYVDDELMHSGVKGMKWHKHKYVTVKNGQYIYNHGQLVKDTKANAAEVADEADYYYNQARQGLNTAGNSARRTAHRVDDRVRFEALKAKRKAVYAGKDIRNKYKWAKRDIDAYASDAKDDITETAKNTYNTAKAAYKVGVGKMTREGKRVKTGAQNTYASAKKQVGRTYNDIRDRAEGAYDDVRSGVRSASKSTSKTYNNASKQVSRTAKNVSKSASKTYSNLRDRADDAYDDVRSGARSASKSASKTYNNLRKDVSRTAKNASKAVSGAYKDTTSSLEKSYKSTKKKANKAKKNATKTLRGYASKGKSTINRIIN